MNVFDPTRGFNAFAQGAQIGGSIRQAQTNSKLAPMVAAGNYKGAADYAGQRGDLGGAERYGAQYAEQQKTQLSEEQERRRRGALQAAMEMMATPEGQRTPEMAASLLGKYGVDGIDPSGITDLSDTGITKFASAMQDTDFLQKQFEEMQKTQVVADGAQVWQGGRMVGENPKDAPPPKYATTTTADGVVAYNTADPTKTQNLGPAPVKSPLVQNTVNGPDMKGETEFQKERGKAASSAIETINEKGDAAQSQLANLGMMEALLDNIDYTGYGGDTLLTVQRIGNMMGFEIPDLPAKEAAKRLSNRMALALKSDLPGPMSNADREFLVSIPPNLNVTPQGNDALLYILRKREQFASDMQRSLMEANPQTSADYYAWENQFRQNYGEMFTPQERQMLLMDLSGTSDQETPQ